MKTPSTPKLSAGLRFLETAYAALPRTLGDRIAIAAMNDVLAIAIRCRMSFDRDDADRLSRLNRHTCVGVFRPLDEGWYTSACRAGGTFAAMWERHRGQKPWIAPTVFIGRSTADQLQNSRVAPHMALLLPSGSGDDGPDWPTFAGFEVWWCTSFEHKADTITLCRYRHGGETRYPLARDGQPARRRVLRRAAWASLFAPAEAVAA